MAGRDTLALLPTGGGKSICFQVPGLAMEGICLVISPLIALMKDQVQNLKKRNIPAVALYSGMNRFEIELIYNNCAYGNIKFLYVSPERLENEDFIQKLQEWRISMLAVDEAHCISQWGYDFRPPYLRIAAIREKLPGIPVMALTATATTTVVEDIQQKLKFPRSNVFQQSFSRENLAYLVLKEEDKRGRLLRIVNKTRGTGIIYVRNRKKTAEIAQWLTKNGIPSSCYHAGLDPLSRSKRQDDWMNAKVRVMVATNAFGMGIDKPDVRFVVHLDLPENLEAYFQEAGRAGRDGKNSYSVILYDTLDITNLRTNFSLSYPDAELIRHIYLSLANYCQVPEGGGKDSTTDFEIAAFCQDYKFNPVTVFKVLSFLEKEGYILLTDDPGNASRIHIRASREELYQFQVRHAYFDDFIKLILRSYGGLFIDFAVVRESELAKRSGLDAELVKKYLFQLHTMGILTYLPGKTKPQLVFCRERVNEKHILISNNNYLQQKENARTRMVSVINYISLTNHCRSLLLLDYFGEKATRRCGKCDVCLKRNKAGISDYIFNEISDKLKLQLQQQPEPIDTIRMKITGFPEEKVIMVLNWLIENGQVLADKKGKMYWNEN